MLNISHNPYGYAECERQHRYESVPHCPANVKERKIITQVAILREIVSQSHLFEEPVRLPFQ
jgi:hypothetical protein